MQVKITVQVPVDVMHGITVGRIFDVVRVEPHQFKVRQSRGYWVKGDTGEEVKIWPGECEVLPDSNNDKGA